MSEPKTKKTGQNVERFLKSLDNPARTQFCRAVMEMMQTITGESPAMWGESMIGFGEYTYRYASGREGQWFLTGVSPRKQSLSIYIMSGFDGLEHLLEQLGQYKTGKCCLYVNRMDDVNLPVLHRLIEASVNKMKTQNG